MQAARAAADGALSNAPGRWQQALPPLELGVLWRTLELGAKRLGGRYLADPGDSEEARMQQVLLIGRNLVVAPFTEEWVFRACVCALLLQGGFSHAAVVLLSPLLFGVAHLHHLYRLVRVERMPLARAAVQCIFQFAYTTLFGMFAGFVMLRTGSVGASVAAHSLCNFFGFPDVGALGGIPRDTLGVTLGATVSRA